MTRLERKENMTNLSDCERRILGCIYEHYRKEEEAPNLKKIVSLIEQKYEKQWKLQTVCTFLTRMEKKGVITIQKMGRNSYYYPVIAYEEYVRLELKELCEIYFEQNEKRMKQFIKQM